MPEFNLASRKNCRLQMLELLPSTCVLVVVVIALLFVLEEWFSSRMATNVTIAMKGLVDQLKEYNLSTKAGLIVLMRYT